MMGLSEEYKELVRRRFYDADDDLDIGCSEDDNHKGYENYLDDADHRDVDADEIKQDDILVIIAAMIL